jgi:hypothetical protein
MKVFAEQFRRSVQKIGIISEERIIMADIQKRTGKRLNIVLDSISFGILSRTRRRHGDTSYTSSIKRAIATASFIDEQITKGNPVFVGNKKTGELREVLVD